MDTFSPSKKAALYIRVSTHSQEELSPDSQKRLLLDYAKKNQFQVEEQWIFQENGISGRTAQKRPQFQKMIASAKSESHPFDAILVWKFSRFARNQEESIVYKSMLRGKYGVDVISISEPIMEGPFGSLIERIIEWMDEFYSIRLSGDVSRGMTEKALRGGYQSRPPFGYQLSCTDGRLEPDPQKSLIIKQIFSWYVLDGLSPFFIAQKLNTLGISTSLGNPFETRAVKYILQNPLYAGTIRWNRTDGKTGTIRDSCDWILAQGHHPAIISKDLFDATQKRLSNEAALSHPYAKPSQMVRHWLGGILKCPNCGRSLCSCRRRRKTMPDTFSFQCSGYLKGLCRKNCYVSEDVIVPIVLKELETAVPFLYQQLISSDLTVSQKNAALKQSVEKIVYNRDEKRIQVYYHPAP
ncbi:MAG: recombinase family protein [Lachnospiraceae bacterium]